MNFATEFRCLLFIKSLNFIALGRMEKGLGIYKSLVNLTGGTQEDTVVKFIPLISHTHSHKYCYGQFAMSIIFYLWLAI